eukprot:m.60710 g.60710  ORF g.60710 m.60710 type:complete len:180 (+) comp9522_c0_seq1:2480-3019(+)
MGSPCPYTCPFRAKVLCPFPPSARSVGWRRRAPDVTPSGYQPSRRVPLCRVPPSWPASLRQIDDMRDAQGRKNPADVEVDASCVSKESEAIEEKASSAAAAPSASILRHTDDAIPQLGQGKRRAPDRLAGARQFPCLSCLLRHVAHVPPRAAVDHLSVSFTPPKVLLSLFLPLDKYSYS